MGLPVHQLIAATNINHVVPDYLLNGQYQPQQSRQTISNAMDVGDPSNFPRMLALYGAAHRAMAADIKGYWFTDDDTRAAMADILKSYDYQADPHGAIAYAGLREFGLSDQHTGIFVETAHPAKFPAEVENSTGKKVNIPDSLTRLLVLDKKVVEIQNDYDCFREQLLSM
jgi:threonine synthase